MHRSKRISAFAAVTNVVTSCMDNVFSVMVDELVRGDRLRGEIATGEVACGEGEFEE